MFVFVTAKDNGTMLREAQLNATLELLDQIGGNIELGTVGGFYKFCTDFCELNEPIRHFAVFFSNSDNTKHMFYRAEKLKIKQN